MIPKENLQRLLERFEFIEAKMSSPLSSEELAKLGREYAELKPVIETINAYNKLYTDLAQAEQMRDDPELRELASEEIIRIEATIPAQEHAVKLALLPKDDADSHSAILEIRAGTGGDEAALFAGDLLGMYQRFAETQGWKVSLIDGNESELGGYKQVVLNITGNGVFAKLKYESGVHRVQRVPATEAGGRIHTSAATVAVLPEAEEVEIDINLNDLRIDTMRASGSGGQHVNKTESAVRITHIPTGIVVVSSEKSQHQNRAIAMSVLKSRIYDLRRREVDDARASDRRAQVGSGDRSERIRTYNFPQGRVTDHRINLTLYKLDAILTGDLLEIIEALTTYEQAEKLAAMGL